MMSYTDSRRHLLEACCLEATKAVSDGPLSERSWAWFHFLHRLLFTDGRQMSTTRCVSMESLLCIDNVVYLGVAQAQLSSATTLGHFIFP